MDASLKHCNDPGCRRRGEVFVELCGGIIRFLCKVHARLIQRHSRGRQWH